MSLEMIEKYEEKSSIQNCFLLKNVYVVESGSLRASVTLRTTFVARGEE